MPFQIEKNVPMAARGSARKGRPAKYPWAEMEVGDSFFSPSDGATAATMRAGAQKAGKRLGFTFAVRVVEDGVRVWRVA